MEERLRLHVVLANAHGVWSAREGCLTGRWMVLAMFSVLSGAGSPWQCEIRLYVQLLDQVITSDQDQYLVGKMHEFFFNLINDQQTSVTLQSHSVALLSVPVAYSYC